MRQWIDLNWSSILLYNLNLDSKSLCSVQTNNFFASWIGWRGLFYVLYIDTTGVEVGRESDEVLGSLSLESDALSLSSSLSPDLDHRSIESRASKKLGRI